MNEVFQLYTGTVLGTPKNQQSPTMVFYVEAYPVFFARFVERIYVESDDTWYDLDTYLPVPKHKKDKIVGAVMPNYANNTLVPYVGPEFEALKQQAADSSKRKHRITDVPVEVIVEKEVIKVETVPYNPPSWMSLAIVLSTIATVGMVILNMTGAM